MSDACFLCLEHSQSRVCTQCLVVAHPTCWSLYVTHGNHRMTIKCPQCNIRLPIDMHRAVGTVTRSMARSTLASEFSRTVKAVLCDIHFSMSQPIIRNQLLFDLFDYICRNQEGMSPPFKSVVHRKLVELWVHEEWEPADTFFHRLYGYRIGESDESDV